MEARAMRRKPTTTLLSSEWKPLRQKIRAMWEQRLDTAAMAKALQVHESLVERELHAILETRHKIVNSLRPV